MSMYCNDFNQEIGEDLTQKMKIFQEEMQRLYILGQEFNYKVHYDFKRCVLLSVKENMAIPLEPTIEEASNCPGYERHRIIQYHSDNGAKVCHIYLKYKTCQYAYMARDLYRTKVEFNAELMDDVLRNWYGYEIMCGKSGETIGVLEVVGQAKFTIPLSDEIARRVLVPFGNPRLIETLEHGIRVGFSTMSEGISACVVLGQWFVKSKPQDARFYYRLLLENSDHFTHLVNKCNQNLTAVDAYRLEYFVPRTEYKITEKETSVETNYGVEIGVTPAPANYESAVKGNSYLPLSSTSKFPVKRHSRKLYKQVKNSKSAESFSYKSGSFNGPSASLTIPQELQNFPPQNIQYFYSNGTYS